jgi:hypothetical protein
MDIKKQIDSIFETSTHQSQVVVEIYKIFFPDWDKIQKISGFPKAGEKLSRYIWDKFIQFDKTNHPNVMAGGLWMNCGFGSSEELEDWQVDISTCEVFQ